MQNVLPIVTVNIWELLFTVIGSIAASSGFWFWLEKRNSRKSVQNRLLKGLAHDRILYLGMRYIKKGWISRDEYENLYHYLYAPYKEMEGNGTVKRIMCEVDKLPIKDDIFKKESACDEIT